MTSNQAARLWRARRDLTRWTARHRMPADFQGVPLLTSACAYDWLGRYAFETPTHPATERGLRLPCQLSRATRLHSYLHANRQTPWSKVSRDRGETHSGAGPSWLGYHYSTGQL